MAGSATEQEIGGGRRSRRVRRLVGGGLFFVVVACALGFLLAPPLIRRAVVARLQPYAAGKVSVGTAWVDASGTLGLEHFEIRSSEGNRLVHVERILVKGAVPNLLRADGIPEEVVLEGATLACVVSRDGMWQVVLPLRLPPRERIPRIRFERGKLVLPDGQIYDLRSCELRQGELPGEVVARLGLEGPLGETVEAEGQFHRFRGSARFDVYARNVQLPHPLLTHVPWFEKRLEEAGASVQGRVSLRAVLTHSADAPFREGWAIQCQVVFNDTIVRFAELPLPVRELSGTLEYAGGALQLQDVAGSLGAGRITASGTIGRKTTLEVAVDNVRLGDLFGDDRPQLSRWRNVLFAGKVRLTGGPRPETWAGSLEGLLAGPSLPGKQVAIRVTVQEGTVRLDPVRWSWAGGEVALWGTGRLDDAELKGGMQITNVRLDTLGFAFSDQLPVNAFCSAEISLRVPLRSIGNLRAWDIRGTARLDNIEDPERYIGFIEGAVEKPAGSPSVSVNNLNGELLGIPVRGSLAYGLDDRNWRLWLQTPQELDVTRFAQLLPGYLDLPPVRGVCRVTLNGVGSIADSHYQLTVLVYVPNIVYGEKLALHDFTISVLHSDEGGTRLKSTPFRYAGGEWVVEASVTRQGQRGTLVSGEMDFKNVDVQQVASLLLAGAQIDLGGSAAGQVDFTWRIGPAGAESPRGTLTLSSDRLDIGHLVLTNAVACGTFDGKQVRLAPWSGSLETLGPAEGTLTFVPGSDEIPLTLRLKRVDLSELTRSGNEEPACDGTAVADLTGKLRLSDRTLELSGPASSPSLRFLRFAPTGPARATVELRGIRLDVRDFAAEAWGGILEGDFSRELTAGAPSHIAVKLTNTSLEALVGRDGRDLSARVSGRVNGEGQVLVETVNGRRRIRGHGSFQVASGRFGRLPVRTARGAIYFDGEGYDIVFTEMYVGDGTANGTLTVIPGDIPRFEASFSFREVSLPFLLVNLTGTEDPVAGRITGSLELRGTLEGWHTVDGVIYVTRLSDADLWRLPVFDAIAEFLLPGVARPGVFHDGRGRIAIEKGALVVDGFALSGAAAQIYIRRGRIWPDGRVELEFIGNAETLIPAQAPLVGIVRRFADNVQHRLVRFYVTGTLRQPRVRALPLADVSGPAIEFFRSLMRGP